MKKALSFIIILTLLLSTLTLTFTISAEVEWTKDYGSGAVFGDDGSLTVTNSSGWSIHKTRLNGVKGYSVEFDCDLETGAYTRVYFRSPAIHYFYMRLRQSAGSLYITCQFYNGASWTDCLSAQTLSCSGPYHVTFDVDRNTGKMTWIIQSKDKITTYYNKNFDISILPESFFDETQIQLMIGAEDDGCKGTAKFYNFELADKTNDLSVGINGTANITNGLTSTFTSNVFATYTVSSYAWTLTKNGNTVTTQTTANFEYLFNEAGLYDLQIVVKDNKGNTAKSTMTVTVIDLDSELSKWQLSSGITGELDANNKAILYANKLNGWANYKSSIFGDEGFDIEFDMEFTSNDNATTILRFYGTSSNIFMRLQGNKSTGKIYASLQFWKTSDSSWNPNYYPTISKKLTSSNKIHVVFIHEEGTSTMTWKITSDDESVTYLNEVYDSKNAESTNFFNENLTFYIGGEGSGTWTYSNFTGLKSNDKNMRTLAYESVCYVNETGNDASWQSYVNSTLKKYQGSAVTATTKKVGETANADLIVLSYGTSLLAEKKSVEDFTTKYEEVVNALRTSNPNSVIVLESISKYDYVYDKNVERHALYNLAISDIAEKNEKMIYADTYSSVALSAWNNSDETLIGYDICTAIAQNSVCMSITSGSGFPTYGTKAHKSTSTANALLTKMKSAISVSALKTLVEDSSSFLTLDVYNKMSDSARTLCVKKLFETGFSTLTADETNQLFVKLCYLVAYENANRTDATPTNGIKKLVVVGDSISWGACSTDSANNRWVALCYERMKTALGTNITIDTEYSIPGTKLTDWTDNRAYPAMNTVVQSAVIDKNPDMLWIAYGINDLNNNVSYEDYMDAFDEYLDTIRTALPSTVIVVVGLTYEGSNINREKIEQWNLGYRELADKYDCAYADLFNMLVGSEWLLYDNLHPTDIGYMVCANAVYSAILSKCNLNSNSCDAEAKTLLTEETPSNPEEDTSKGDETTQEGEITKSDDKTKTEDTTNDAETRKGCASSISYLSILFILFASCIVLFTKRKKIVNK